MEIIQIVALGVTFTREHDGINGELVIVRGQQEYWIYVLIIILIIIFIIL